MSKIKLESSKKSHLHGQDKVISPEETVNNVLEKLETSDLDLLKEIEIRENKYEYPSLRCHGGEDYTSVVNKPFTGGKGTTLNQAKASGLMELVERYSNFTHEYNRIEVPGKIQREVKVSPLKISSLKEKSLEKQKKIKRTRVPWTKGYNLTKKKEVFLPIIYRFYEGSNGMAAGNSLEEAIIQALCEIIEREVSTKVCEEKLNTPTIDKSSIENSVAMESIKKFEERGAEVIVKDFSLGLGIPTIGVMTIDKDLKYPITLTSGTHTDPSKALIRALTENVQVSSASHKKTHIAFKGREGIPRRKVVPLTGHKLSDFDFVSEGRKNIKMSKLPDCSDRDIKKEIESCLDILKKNGYNVIVVDTTHENLGIPSVHVFVPESIPLYDYNIGDLYNWLSFNFYERGDYKNSLKSVMNSIKFKGPLNYTREKFSTLLHY